MLPKPFHFTIDPRRPLLILSCSALKRDVAGFIRFCDRYDGPLWNDLRRSGFPLTNVAAISGLYGYLPPGQPIENYDREMNEDKALRTIGQGCDLYQLSQNVKAAAGAFVIGGALYRSIVEAGVRQYDLRGVTYGTGTFLQLRKQLNVWLREQTAADAAKAAA